MSEIQDHTLFTFTCGTCGHDGFVHSPQDATSNLAEVDCPSCGAPLLAYSMGLSQENRIALMEEMLQWLEDTFNPKLTEADVEAISDETLKGGLLYAGLSPSLVQEAREFLRNMAKEGSLRRLDLD
jgi:hypothetical protein